MPGGGCGLSAGCGRNGGVGQPVPERAGGAGQRAGGGDRARSVGGDRHGDWWVLWVDSGYRTLAIGTPDGRFGFVLDRGRIGPDRLVAAAEIFDFNGYSKARFKPF